MGTELVRSEDLVKAMATLESEWANLPAVRNPRRKNTVESIETGKGIPGSYVAKTLGTFAAVASIGTILLGVSMEIDHLMAITVFAGSAVAFGPFGIEQLCRDNGVSPLGRLDTRVLRRKKYRSIAAREQMENMESVKEYMSALKKRKKAEKKLLQKAKQIASEAGVDMVFEDGSFKPEKASSNLSSREIELMGHIASRNLQLEILP